MNKRLLILRNIPTLILFVFIFLLPAKAQNLDLFWLRDLSSSEVTNRNVAFVSMTEKYRFSEHPDFSAIPDLIEISGDEYKQFEYLILDSIYRERFFDGCQLSLNDKVFIYSYTKQALITLPVSELNVVACTNMYGAEWPFTQSDFMFGFEIDNQVLHALGSDYENALVFVGKKSPFAISPLKQVKWQKISEGEFPLKEPLIYDMEYTGTCTIKNTYKFQDAGMAYFLQEMVRVNDDFNAVNRLLVIDAKTQNVICDKVMYAGESASFAPLDNQWTGVLFKNKKPVIFGFQWVSFGCPFITVLNAKAEDIYINCDNWH